MPATQLTPGTRPLDRRMVRREPDEPFLTRRDRILSVSQDRTVQSTPTTPVPGSGIADPAPLGLAAFALTTFLLSARNAGWMTHTTGDAWLGFALAYGGLAQLLAAMWEFRNKNVVGATGFGTFGAFWVGLGFCILLVVSPAVAAVKTPLELAATVTAINHDLGWILLGFAVFTTYVLILVTQTNTALFATFLLLWVTFIVLCIGNFNAGAACPRPHNNDQDRRLPRRGHRGRRLVHLGGGHLDRHGRQAQVPRGPAAHQVTP